MMLSPNNRGVYTDALTPPAGFELDRAIAAAVSQCSVLLDERDQDLIID